MTGQIPHAAFTQAVENAAAMIAADLGIRPGCDTSFGNVFTLVEKYGGNAFFVNLSDVNERNPGMFVPCDGNTHLFIWEGLPRPARATVLLHELMHRLIYSDAYEPLNAAEWQFSGFDRRAFDEAVCRAVERLFVECGGFDYRAQLGRKHRAFAA